MRAVLASAKNRQATGVDRYAREIAAALRALGVTTREVVIERREARIAGIRMGGSLSLWAQRLRAARGDADVLHALDPNVVSKGTDVVTIHDLLIEEYASELQPTARARLDWRMTRALAKRVPFLITHSEAGRQEVLRRWGVAPERVVASHLGIDHATFHPVTERSPLLAEGKPTLAYVGDDNPRKNVGLLVHALADLRARHGIEARLVRVGPSRHPAIHEAYRASARSSNVDLVEPGYVDDAALVALLSHVDAFLWPSRGEGFGFPPVEAMACGAPVVALDTPVAREVLGPGARYHADDARACADAIAATLTSRASRVAQVDLARAYTWEAAAKRHLAVYGRAKEARR